MNGYFEILPPPATPSSHQKSTPGGSAKNVQVKENDLHITFTKVESLGEAAAGEDGHDSFNVVGRGKNKYGPFELEGTAVPTPPGQVEPHPPTETNNSNSNSNSNSNKPHNTYTLTLRKCYVPASLPPATPLSDSLVTLRGKLTTEVSIDGLSKRHSVTGNWALKRSVLVSATPTVTPTETVTVTGTDTDSDASKIGSFELCYISADMSRDVSLTGPISGRWNGWFTYDSTLPGSPPNVSKITEKEFQLRFERNASGYWNVAGKGTNQFGKYDIKGLYGKDDRVLEIYKVFKVLASTAPQTPKAKLEQQLSESNSDGSNSNNPPKPLVNTAQLSEIVMLPNADPTPAPEPGGYSAVMDGFLRVSDAAGAGDGAASTCTHSVSGKWALGKEDLPDESKTSKFDFR